MKKVIGLTSTSVNDSPRFVGVSNTEVLPVVDHHILIPKAVRFVSDEPRQITPKFTNPVIVMQYSIDEGETWHATEHNVATPLSNKIWFRGTTNSNNGVLDKSLYTSSTLNNAWVFSGPSSNKLNVYGTLGYLLTNDLESMDFIRPSSMMATAGNFAFSYMFYNCSALVTPPTLPFTDVYDSAYAWMFYNCTSLVEAPELPALNLRRAGIYANMFRGCTSLVTAPALPSTEVGASGGSTYAFMFQDCTSLIEAPNLPCLSPGGPVYTSMFQGCTSLVEPPIISATSMVNSSTITGAMTNMFQGCTSLTTGPDLLSLTVPVKAYSGMFYGCTSLVEPPIISAIQINYESMLNMFSGCTSLTTPPELHVTNLGSTISTSMGLQGAMTSMFQNCTSLVTAPTLPATTAPNMCYLQMFYGCTSLVTAPALPATTIGEVSYSYMFCGCSSLVTAPALPATTIGISAYSYMFYGCSSLVTAPVLPATTLAPSCYLQMFYGCSSLVTAPVLPATTLTTQCYREMFTNCSNLQTVYLAYPNADNPSNVFYSWMLRAGTLTGGTSILYKAGTQFATTGTDTYPSTWTQVLWTP